MMLQLAVFEIQNKGSVGIYLQETTSQPSSTSTDGKALNAVDEGNDVGTITAGSNTIWARAASSTTSGRVNIQGV